MKTVNEFKNGVNAYLKHLFPTTSAIVMEDEEGDDSIYVRCHHGEHTLELRAIKEVHYLRTFMKIKALPEQNLEQVNNLEYSYKYRRIGDCIFLGIKDSPVAECFIKYELEGVIRDFISLINYFDHGIVKLPRFLDYCAFKDLPIRAKEKREQLHSELIRMKMFFNQLSQKEFDGYPDKTKFVFDDNGNFKGVDVISPPSAFVITKGDKYKQSLDEIIEFLDRVYKKAINNIDQRLNHLINDFSGSFYTTGVPFDNLSYQETLDYYSLYGEDPVYYGTTPYYAKYLQWDTWVQCDYMKRI